MKKKRGKENEEEEKKKKKKHRTKNVGHYSLSWYSVARARFRSLHFFLDNSKERWKTTTKRYVYVLNCILVEIFFLPSCNDHYYLQWNSFVFHSNKIGYLFHFFLSSLPQRYVFVCWREEEFRKSLKKITKIENRRRTIVDLDFSSLIFAEISLEYFIL